MSHVNELGNVAQRLYEYQSKKAELENFVREFEADFERVIADQTYPLDQRWQMFVDAPDSLKNHKMNLQHFDSVKGEISWYDDFRKERHEKIEMAEVVERIEEWLDEYPSNDYAHKILMSIFKQDDNYEPSVDALKEEILLNNLGSFENDW